MKKRMMIGLVLFLLVLSSFSVLASDDTCTGFWGSISCFLFGSAENRAGKSWFDRGN